MTIKFAQESLEIYSWVKKMQYSAFCQALGSGVYQHLQVGILSSSWLRGLSASTGGYSVKLLAQGSISIYRWVFCQALGSGVYQHLQVGILSSSWLRGLSASTGG